MNKLKKRCDNEVTRAMTQVVLNDILNSVIEEFEERTDSTVGKITVYPKETRGSKRIITAEITQTGERCVSGLVEFRKLLCRHKPFQKLGVCETS